VASSGGSSTGSGWSVPGGRGLVVVGLAVATVAVLAVGVVAAQQSADTPHRAAGAAGGYQPRTRTYYLAADEVRWNYAPAGRNQLTGRAFDDTAATFVRRGPTRIGSTYLKSLYREYTDASFRTLKPRPPQWRHLGMLGPVIRGVVGDQLQIVLKNHLDRPVSIHVHGIRYDKASEGANYADNTDGPRPVGGAVPPGQVHTYTYSVPERAGPGPMDPSSVMWMYHSHTDEVGDDYAGLVGPLIITRADQARPDGTPSDVDRELVAQFQVNDENQSPYLDRNLKTFTGAPGSVDPGDDDFVESNLMHNINGYLYGNQPLAPMTVHLGQRVRWYLMAMGTEVDLHTPHWHGNTVVAMGMRTDVVSLLPATMLVADMIPDAAGTWLFHCHVNDHITAGMLTRYQVVAH
jgi:FtsP/CotA-like multicopper oxidase with cupredoxin domain